MGLFDFFGGKKDSGRDAGNVLTLNQAQRDQAGDRLSDLLNYKGSAAANDPLESSRIATQEVQNNPILSKMFAQGGQLDRTDAEEQRLATQGFKLTPEDHEAYGQMSGQLARDFDQSEQSLAQALASRGMLSSGAANQSFGASQGNKFEQLAGLQRKIANDRMQNNMQRLGQTRQFLSQLNNQGQNAIQDQYGRQMGSEQNRFSQTLQQSNAGRNALQQEQNQANENLSQRMGSERQQGWASAVQGIGNTAEAAGMAYLSGGLSQGDSKKKQPGQQLAGQPSPQDPNKGYA